MNQINKRRERTLACLTAHYQTYPKLQTEDIFKYLFQSAFGCEHLVSNEETALTYIKKEYASLTEIPTTLTDKLDGAYTRVHLSCLRNGIRPETLARLFCLSAKKEPDGKVLLEEKLCAVKEWIADGVFPLDADEFERKLAAWRADGYPAVHHSAIFRAEYHPAYRVIANRYADRLDLFSEIDKRHCKGVMTVSAEDEEILREVYGAQNG